MDASSLVEGTYTSPIHGSVSTGGNRKSLNEKLQTEYVDVGHDRNSVYAQMTQAITAFVGTFVTPRTLLIVLRVLKAVTFCFLVLNFAADLMYITFLHILASKDVQYMVGGRRDMIIRVYGLALAVIAVCIELDVTSVMKRFSGLRGFMPRGCLLFFISAITGSHPMNEHQVKQDDDVIADDEFADFTSEIPDSAVAFQMTTSFFLGVCAVTYFVSGVLCFDRFTSRAFISPEDPVARTAIPLPSGVQTPSHEQSMGPV